ncbi:MAG: hypothetical protein HY558_08060 [Euryarchaeota archaeon]|nr:hypothetical protein [Euryarchaeota archaeon]
MMETSLEHRNPRRPLGAPVLKAILVLPGTMTVLIPTLLLLLTSPWPIGPPRLLLAAPGALLLAGGLLMMHRTISLFARVGRGTLAPWDPPKHLVVEGVYRRVRNPMMVGVVGVLLGEALLLDSRALLLWGWLFPVMAHLFIVLAEEPQLEGRFGEEYRRYKESVPRWIPRRRLWEAGNP